MSHATNIAPSASAVEANDASIVPAGGFFVDFNAGLALAAECLAIDPPREPKAGGTRPDAFSETLTAIAVLSDALPPTRAELMAALSDSEEDHCRGKHEA